jgi:hypothetical protein
MQSDQKPDLSPLPEVGLAAPKSTSRRRLLKAGLGVSPVVLTFVSQPVPASFTTVTCRAASAFASVQAALAAGVGTSANTAQLCSGNLPSSWKGLSRPYWPGGSATADLLFTSLFGPYTVTTIGTATVPAVTTDAPTLFQVLCGAGTTARDVLARNIVAAYLNLQQGLVPATVVSSTQLQSMWLTAGNTVPSPYLVNGLSGGWSLAQVNQFLAHTFS